MRCEFDFAKRMGVKRGFGCVLQKTTYHKSNDRNRPISISISILTKKKRETKTEKQKSIHRIHNRICCLFFFLKTIKNSRMCVRISYTI